MARFSEIRTITGDNPHPSLLLEIASEFRGVVEIIQLQTGRVATYLENQK